MVRTYLLHVSELADDVLFQKCYDRLSEERRRKTDGFYFRKDKNLCVGAGVLLDFGLEQLRNERPDMLEGFDTYELSEKNLVMAEGDNGKPYFKQLPKLFFNISHSEECVAAAFSDSEIGIDIEKITSIDLDIAKNYFFMSEYDAIKRQTSDEARNDCFFNLWTLKESFMKAVGLGMALPLDQFEIVPGNPVRVYQNISDKDFYFRQYEVAGYKLAVCSTSL